MNSVVYKNIAPGDLFNYNITVKEGCKGCGRTWRDSGEGRCYKCHRCLACCGGERRMYSCKWRYNREYSGTSNAAKRIVHEKHVAAGIEGFIRREFPPSIRWT